MANKLTREGDEQCAPRFDPPPCRASLADTTNDDTQAKRLTLLSKVACRLSAPSPNRERPNLFLRGAANHCFARPGPIARQLTQFKFSSASWQPQLSILLGSLDDLPWSNSRRSSFGAFLFLLLSLLDHGWRAGPPMLITIGSLCKASSP
jgi:hypothetical protein